MAVSSSLERALRSVLIGTFVPSFILCLVAGIVVQNNNSWHWYGPSNLPVIYFGSILTFISTVASSAFFIAQRQHALRLGNDEPAKWRRTAMLWVDAVMGAGYTALLVCIWILDRNLALSHGGVGMLLAYSTFPLMVNWLIHLYITFAAIIPNIIAAYRNRKANKLFAAGGCPNCQHCRHQREITETAAKPSNKEGYSLLRAEEYDDDAEGSSAARVSADV